MSDLISRQAAIDAIRNIKAIKGTSDDKILLIDKAEAQTELMMLPSAQPEITRCKDCEHWTNDDCPFAWGKVEDAFCSYAERRTDESNMRDK